MVSMALARGLALPFNFLLLLLGVLARFLSFFFVHAGKANSNQGISILQKYLEEKLPDQCKLLWIDCFIYIKDFTFYFFDESAEKKTKKGEEKYKEKESAKLKWHNSWRMLSG